MGSWYKKGPGWPLRLNLAVGSRIFSCLVPPLGAVGKCPGEAGLGAVLFLPSHHLFLFSVLVLSCCQLRLNWEVTPERPVSG